MLFILEILHGRRCPVLSNFPLLLVLLLSADNKYKLIVSFKPAIRRSRVICAYKRVMLIQSQAVRMAVADCYWNYCKDCSHRYRVVYDSPAA